MLDVVQTGWSHVHPADGFGDERGTTTLDYVMAVALVVATVVMLASVGASLAGAEVV